jgi:FkbM family methyltransferase
MADSVIGSFRKLINGKFNRLLHTFDRSHTSELIKEYPERSLYRTRFNDLFWLNTEGYVDQCIIESGVFEPSSTEIVKHLVKSGDVVLDVGANIGYYSVILSKLVGEEGKVYCFEPTDHYGKVLKMNLAENNARNVEIFKVGLSNQKSEVQIQIGPSSATLHSPGKVPLLFTETIQLISLDEWLEDRNLTKIDFIKIDIDGHEPLFLQGAWNALDRYNPTILLEVSHPHYLDAGFTAWDFYDLLKGRGYRIYFEDKLTEITTKEDFLIKCGNFAYSANIVIAKKELRME